MHNTTEIEKSLEDYPLIPMDDIEDEARLLAVRWVEGYEPAGFDLPNKHKLASNIMNYAKRKKLNSDSTAENKGQQKGMKWVKLSDRVPEKKGAENKVKIRSTDPKWSFVDEGFMNYADDPQMIIERAGKLMVTTEYPADYHSSFPKKYIEWLDESATDKPEELQEEVERLRAALEKSNKVLLDYEQWEADIIGDNRCWEPCGMASNPTIISELWDNLIEIQAKRNDVLHPGKYTPPQPENQK